MDTYFIYAWLVLLTCLVCWSEVRRQFAEKDPYTEGKNSPDTEWILYNALQDNVTGLFRKLYALEAYLKIHWKEQTTEAGYTGNFKGIANETKKKIPD